MDSPVSPLLLCPYVTMIVTMIVTISVTMIEKHEGIQNAVFDDVHAG